MNYRSAPPKMGSPLSREHLYVLRLRERAYNFHSVVTRISYIPKNNPLLTSLEFGGETYNPSGCQARIESSRRLSVISVRPDGKDIAYLLVHGVAYFMPTSPIHLICHLPSTSLEPQYLEPVKLKHTYHNMPDHNMDLRYRREIYRYTLAPALLHIL